MWRNFPALATLSLIAGAFLGCVIGLTTLVAQIGNFALLLLAPVIFLAVLAAALSSPTSPRAGSSADRGSGGEGEPREGIGLAGTWNGTARIWPAGSGSVLRVLPVRLKISVDPAQVRLIPHSACYGRERIVAVELLEHDATDDDVDLQVTVEGGDRREEYVARLRRESGVLVPVDETDPFTLELHQMARPRLPA